MAKLFKFLLAPLLNEYGVAGTISGPGLDALANGIQGLTGMKLEASESASSAASVAEADVAFTASSGSAGLIEITADVTITIPSATTITYVYLTHPTLGDLGFVNITTNNIFTNGGDLIVTSYEITVV